MKTRIITMKSLLRTIPVWMLSLTLMAQEGQNMVDNGDFDQTLGKLRRLGQIDQAQGWISPTGVSADLFSKDAKMPEVLAPDNSYGKEEPKSGNGYAGIKVYSYNDKEKRTYITTRLNTPMKKGMRYKVQFYASLAEMSKYSANRLGAHFSKKEISTKEKVPALIDETHVEHPNKEKFTGLYGWDLVCGEYVASGGEKYLTIGNFTPNNDVDYERNKTPRDVKGIAIIAAYYYIDDISVQLLGPNEQCDCAYGNVAEPEKATLYQREPNINDKMSLEDKIAEYQVYYQKGRYDVTMAGDKVLDEIAKILVANPNLKLQIIGHLDNDEADDPQYKDISLKRAEFILNQMVNKSLDASRFTIADKKNIVGSPYIMDYDEDKTKTAKNRRVTFKIVE